MNFILWDSQTGEKRVVVPPADFSSATLNPAYLEEKNEFEVVYYLSGKGLYSFTITEGFKSIFTPNGNSFFDSSDSGIPSMTMVPSKVARCERSRFL